MIRAAKRPLNVDLRYRTDPVQVLPGLVFRPLPVAAVLRIHLNSVPQTIFSICFSSVLIVSETVPVFLRQDEEDHRRNKFFKLPPHWRNYTWARKNEFQLRKESSAMFAVEKEVWVSTGKDSAETEFKFARNQIQTHFSFILNS